MDAVVDRARSLDLLDHISIRENVIGDIFARDLEDDGEGIDVFASGGLRSSDDEVNSRESRSSEMYVLGLRLL